MIPEEIMNKAIEIARKAWRFDEREYRYNKKRGKFQFRYGKDCWCQSCAATLSNEEILFDRWFRQALIGSSYSQMIINTRDLTEAMNWPGHYDISMYTWEYYMTMCVLSDDRIWYLEKVLYQLW